MLSSDVRKIFLSYSFLSFLRKQILIKYELLHRKMRQIKLFNRNLNRGCLVYMFSLRFSGSKILINLRRQFRARKFFSCT